MRILVVQPRISYYIGGGEIVPVYQMAELSKLGNDVTLITTKPSKPSEYLKLLKDANVKVIFSRIKSLDRVYHAGARIPLEAWDSESLMMQLDSVETIKKINPDVIISHYSNDHIVLDNKNIILHLHGYPDNRVERAVIGLGRARKILSVSSEVKTKWQSLFPEFAYKIKKVIHNGITTDFFKPVKTKKIYDLVFVGRLIKIKGLDYLIKAIRGSDLKLAIAGEGPEKERLYALSKKLKVNIDFLGYVNFKDLPRIYSRSKIGVFPSYSREGVLTSMLEAMACGLGVVTTDQGGMKEALKFGGGVTVEAKSSSALSQGIRDVLSDYSKFGISAREVIKEHFNIKENCINLENFYKRAAI
jgi:glycosyltransferase involved in cell wall biosynthesis